mgnify:CR=1 FL=1
MTNINIDKWETIKDEDWSSLLLGNGTSIAIHQGFGYKTLHGVAARGGLLPNAAPIFKRLGTTDFERVLLACWYAEEVNVALKNRSADITAAYAEVREALIKTVCSVHPEHSKVEQDLEQIGKFASDFSTVVSLNYDLTLYWAMQIFNSKKTNWFKDAFILNGKFETNWEYLRRPYQSTIGATLVFYPHGSLSIVRDYFSDEKKISETNSVEDTLLAAITDEWLTGRGVPVFVSEGISVQKVAAIRRSPYLMNVYEKVLSDVGNSLVVYGWSFGDQDQHVLSAIKRKPPALMAVSVYTGQSQADQQAFCHNLSGTISGFMPNTSVKFFDSHSAGCWNNS